MAPYLEFSYLQNDPENTFMSPLKCPESNTEYEPLFKHQESFEKFHSEQNLIDCQQEEPLAMEMN